MLEVNRRVLETLEPRRLGNVDETSELIGRVAVEEGAHVTGSRIVGPAVIGARSQVTGSYIGPFSSVAEDCMIIDSELQYSIVLQGSLIQGVRRIEGSLIGRQVKVTPAAGVSKAHRLVLADHSEVQISS
jgi:glucose-1-phosphate thymidylyltransferase